MRFSRRAAIGAAVIAGLISTATRNASAAPFTAGDLAVFQADTASANNTTFTIVEVNPSTNLSPQSISINGTTGPNALRTSGSAATTGYLASSNDRKLLTFSAHNTTTTSGNINAITAKGVGALDSGGNFFLETTYTGASSGTPQTRGATSLDDTNWLIGDQAGVYINGATSAASTGNYRSIKSFGGTAYVLQNANTVVSTVSSPTGTPVTGLPGLSTDANAKDFYLVSSGSNGSAYDELYLIDTASGAGSILKYSLVSGSWTANGTASTGSGVGGFGLAAVKDGGGADLYMTTLDGATAANSIFKFVDSAGWNQTMSLGSSSTIFTAAAGTVFKGIDFVPVPEPTSLGMMALAGVFGLRRRRA